MKTITRAEIMAHLESADVQALRAEVERLTQERDEARANYQFMVDRAADAKLDGYRELGARAARAENERDEVREECEELGRMARETTAHLLAAENERDEARAEAALARSAATARSVRTVGGLRVYDITDQVNQASVAAAWAEVARLRECNEAMREPVNALREMVAMPAQGEGTVLAAVAERLRGFLVCEAENRRLREWEVKAREAMESLRLGSLLVTEADALRAVLKETP